MVDTLNKQEIFQYYIIHLEGINSASWYGYPTREEMLEVRKREEERWGGVFFKIINKIVSLNGTICVLKDFLSSPYFLYKNSFRIKIKPSDVKIISEMPGVVKVDHIPNEKVNQLNNSRKPYQQYN